jgi:formate dehydrogenase major subunit
VGTQTRRTPNKKWHLEDRLEISREDAEARGIRDGEWVQLTSLFGTTKLGAQFSTRVNAGVVHTTFHHANSRVNRVTSDLSDWATQLS